MAVRAQLDKILSSTIFVNSGRLRRFLRFVVEESLADRGDQIKEYRIGVEVFDRDAAYDPHIDPVVRVEASRVRSKLREYYADQGASDTDLIEVPKGHYTALFRLRVRAAAPRATEAAHPDPRTIAVLPFVDMSPKRDHEYFCDGMTEELISALAQLPELQVVARTSAFEFKGRNVDVRDLGRQLNVGSVVEGSVRAAGGRVRVTAQLISVTDGYHLWSDTLDRQAKDVFAVQDEIARSIVAALKIRLMAGPEQQLVKIRTRDPEAYELCLKGRYCWNKQSMPDMLKAVEFFERAIQRDAEFARAWSGLGHSYSLLAIRSFLPSAAACPQAKAAVTRALAIDSTDAEALVTMAGLGAFYDWDWRSADEGFRRAIELSPSFEDAHHAYARTCLGPQGRFDEAVARMKRAQELDPLSSFIADSLADLNRLAGRPEQCVEQCRKALDSDPGFFRFHATLAAAYCAQGRFDGAITELNAARSIAGNTPFLLSELAYAHALRGDRATACGFLGELDQTSGHRYVGQESYVPALLALGDREQALARIEQAYREHSGGLLYCKVDNRLDPLRNEPAFKRILQEMNLA